MRPNWPRLVIVLVAAAALVSGLVWGAAVIWSTVTKQPLPMDSQCRATASGASVTLTPEQAVNATIITSVALTRGLPARAVTIALTTAYQESGIRNLDYGDRDSVGLFQQRPSQGWGSEKQLMDPYYASNKFYDALAKIKNWQTRDLTEVAQAVQVSGHPEAYRDHEADAKVLASTLTGHSPGGFSCLDRTGADGDAKGLSAALVKTFGADAKATRDGAVLTVTADSAEHAWAYGTFAVANSAQYGTLQVVVHDQQWDTNSMTLPSWVKADSVLKAKQVKITVR